MKRTAVYTLIIIAVYTSACGNKKNIPDVSGIHVQFDTLRFERDFFSIDTLNTEQSLDRLQQKYPSFLNDFLYNLLGLPPNKDSTLLKVKQFMHDYKPVYDSVMLKYPSIQQAAGDVVHALQFV